MKTPGKNLIMADSAFQDRRNTSAMLLGKGDGREQKWIAFSEKKQGFFNEDELYFLTKSTAHENGSPQMKLPSSGRRCLRWCVAVCRFLKSGSAHRAKPV
jgi:hypothetical protein